MVKIKLSKQKYLLFNYLIIVKMNLLIPQKSLYQMLRFQQY